MSDEEYYESLEVTEEYDDGVTPVNVHAVEYAKLVERTVLLEDRCEFYRREYRRSTPRPRSVTSDIPVGRYLAGARPTEVEVPLGAVGRRPGKGEGPYR